MKKLSIPTIILFCAALLGIITLFLPLAGAFTITESNTHATDVFGPAYPVIFGGTVNEVASVSGYSTSGSGKLDGIPAMGLIGWILIVLGVLALAAVIVLGLIKKGESILPIITYVACGVLVVGGIFMFCCKGEIATIVAGKNASADTIKSFKDSMKMNFGFIGTGIFAILAGLTAGASALLPKFIKK